MKVLDEDSIFQQAIKITDESKRKEFLKNSCDSNQAALQRLSSLVNAHVVEERATDVTRACKGDPDAIADVPKVGSTIGPYKLLQEIGDGGMGVVFMAEQTEPVKRKVALKVIKFGMDTRRVVARFESERQAMAMMDHPCITKIFDAGATDSGRPFFVMELVRGKAITTYCDEKKLSISDRLKIFVKVCNAIEHAHQKGVIHRDIKPNNIMVTQQDGQPIPKIIDFGIAKAINDPLTEKTLFTNYGEMVGTPLYMSPEQSEMSEQDIDTRTDIYSLGVLLYELITGTIPFQDLKKKNLQAIREAIRSNEPQLASTRINNLGDTVKEISTNRATDVKSLHRFVRGELDWILMKCLNLDRDRRYQSAGELSDEIVRHLNGDVVEAAAPTWWYRSRKFIRRHKAGVAIAASFSAVLLAGTAFSAMMAVKANEAEKLASSRLEEAVNERNRAQTAEKELAKLERKQRNRVAFHQAASNHNVNMVKRMMADGVESGNLSKESARLPPIKVIPMENCLTVSPGTPKPPSSITFTQSQMDTKFAPGKQNVAWAIDTDCDTGDIELIVMESEPEQEEELLKSILHFQKEAFGKNDVLVARTLNQLGELASNKEKWQQSELYFRDAIAILKDEVSESEQLSGIRMKLVKTMEKQGNLNKVLVELRDIKENFQDLEFREEVTGIMNKIKSKLDESTSDSDSKF